MALPQLVPGMIFARDYRVLRHLSAGGMGAVYVVEQMSTQRQRALKIMLPDLVRDPKNRERFTQEATVGARIRSDHLVEVVAAGIDEATETPWMAMELLEGDELAKVLEQRALSPGELLEVFRQLCHGLGAAHRGGLVHRDLKPQNIFLAHARREGSPYTVKILDFGIAKVIGESRTAAMSTSTLGSPLWMAPEQAEQGAIRPATDVWALGLIAFYALTGAYYWRIAHGDFAIAMLLKEIFVDPLDPASVRAGLYGRAGMIPPGFDAWFSRCVVRDPAMRFHDANEALAALIPVLSNAAGIPVAAQTYPGPLPTAAPLATPPGYASAPVPTPPGYASAPVVLPHDGAARLRPAVPSPVGADGIGSVASHAGLRAASSAPERRIVHGPDRRRRGGGAEPRGGRGHRPRDALLGPIGAHRGGSATAPSAHHRPDHAGDPRVSTAAVSRHGDGPRRGRARRRGAARVGALPLLRAAPHRHRRLLGLEQLPPGRQ